MGIKGFKRPDTGLLRTDFEGENLEQRGQNKD